MTFARQWYTFHYENELPSLTCSHYHMLRKLPGKLQETSLSQPFFPSNKGRYACKLGDRFPKGILLTTHDHALLTKNFCALAPEYKGTLSHLEERAQRAHYRTCYAWHARTCADRRARRVFLAMKLHRGDWCINSLVKSNAKWPPTPQCSDSGRHYATSSLENYFFKPPKHIS